MFDWLSTAWDYTKAGAGYLVDNASNIGTLLAGGAALYSAFDKSKVPSMPAMPSMPSIDQGAVTSTATSLVNKSGPADVGADYKSILAAAATTKAKVKLDTSKAVAAQSESKKRKESIRADIHSTPSVWASYAPISYKTLLGGN